ncbi:ATP-binding protein [Paenibacillus hamazuiensis]|uniref:hybrid sensor histidine kinase/response regulator n=1 Tax=Paenibacillus hamazuiensis TaxID=2936508 RepID=UPI00200F93B1|nr:ATP-binding protein [Paenibacillus hamazuiensis]
MTKRRTILIALLFLAILTGLRLFWIAFQAVPPHPSAVGGVVDLRNWDFSADNTLTLDGQWEFFPGQWLTPSPGGSYVPPASASGFIQVPGSWNRALSGESGSPYGYGTYRLLILVSADNRMTYGIKTQDIRGASELFVNGHLLTGSGQPSAIRELHESRNIPYSGFFTTNEDYIEIVVRVSNYDYADKGGIIGPVSFGSALAVTHQNIFSLCMNLVAIIILLMHGFYAVILFMFRPDRKVLLYFALMVTCTAFTLFTNYEKLLLAWIPLEFGWFKRIQYLSYTGVGAFMLLFTKHLFPEYRHLKFIRMFAFICGLYALFVLGAPIRFVTRTEPLLIFISVLPTLTAPALWLRGALNGKEHAIYLLLSAVGMTSHVTWGVLLNAGLIVTPYYPFDLIVAFLSMASFWFRRLFRMSDQTEQLAARLQQVDKQKDDFLANTSHELRNPLHGILTIAQTIVDTEKHSLGENTKKDLELLISVGRRMSFMLNDLLDFTRLKEQDVRLNMTKVHLQSVASGVLDMIRFMTEGKQIRLSQNIPDTFPFVMADENRLVQIMFNLLHNAVKYTHEGLISISAEIRSGKAHVHITDTGIGMDEATQKRIFLPYEQGDSSLTALGAGIGLGLSISTRLVELHGGTLGVKSASGQGSTFTFTLQLAGDTGQALVRVNESARSGIADDTAAAAVQEPKNRHVSPSASFVSEKPRILAVDDDPVNLKILDNLLSAEQYDIVTVTNGREALVKLLNERWDLVITDVMMPHMSGYELTKLVRERFTVSELPILLLTARSRSEDIAAGFRCGANDYVMKPMDALELKSRVRALTNLKLSFTERLRLEAAWLQAQIKPHFLFNTLNSIAALSEFDTARMRHLLDVFGQYLRTSFDFHNVDRLVPLHQELGLVRSYLFIEKERFQDRLQVIWELGEGAGFRLPPLSVQPLVENAVRHGILPRSRGGTVRIRVAEHPNYAVISVEDDGVGISPERLHEVLYGKPDGQKGIGLYNLERRLKQIYGKGLQIRSHLGRGTIVTMEIPK